MPPATRRLSSGTVVACKSFVLALPNAVTQNADPPSLYYFLCPMPVLVCWGYFHFFLICAQTPDTGCYCPATHASRSLISSCLLACESIICFPGTFCTQYAMLIPPKYELHFRFFFAQCLVTVILNVPSTL